MIDLDEVIALVPNGQDFTEGGVVYLRGGAKIELCPSDYAALDSAVARRATDWPKE